MVAKRDRRSRDETRRATALTLCEGGEAREINSVRAAGACGPEIAPESVATASDEMKEKESSASRTKDDVVLLADLAPRVDVKGGAGRRFFGERLEASEGMRGAEEEVKPMKRTTAKTTLKVKDLAPTSGEAKGVKGGSSSRDAATGQAKRV